MTTSNATCILFITLSLVLIGSIFLAIYAFKKHFELKKEINDLTRFSINISANIDDTIPKLLDLIIGEAFADYQALNTAYKESYYITDDDEKKLRDGLASAVSERLAGPTMDKLSLYYNAPELAKIIADKIYIVVLSYVVNHNTSSMTNEQKAREEEKRMIPNDGTYLG